jgi:hypothetical protein
MTRLAARDLVHGYATADIEADRVQVRWYASLCRVIESATGQNKLAVFGMMAREAMWSVAAHRQQAIDELWEVADSLGLIDLFGTASVHAALCAPFDEGPPVSGAPGKPYETPEGDYYGLTGSFARACQHADREHRQAPRSPAKRANSRLLESARQAVEWLLERNDAERLKNFIAEHSPSEAQAIVDYIKERQS